MLGPVIIFSVGFIIWYYWDRWYRSEYVKDFNTKHVFITGTDTGFGHQLAIDLDAKGLYVYAGCYSDVGADNLRKKASSRLKTLLLDITDRNSVIKAKEFIEQDLPPGRGLWGLVNNAGIIGDLIFDFTSVEDYRSVMEVNFFGQITVTETFLPLIKKARGRIATIISIFGRCSVALVPYTATKFALEPYCDGLRRSMKTFGVHSAIIEPGFHPSTQFANYDVLTKTYEKKWDALPLETKKEYGEKYRKNAITGFIWAMKLFPLSMFNKPAFVADAVTHALGSKRPKSRYLVGYDARLVVWLTTVMPDWMSDVFVRFALQYSTVAAAVKN